MDKKRRLATSIAVMTSIVVLAGCASNGQGGEADSSRVLTGQPAGTIEEGVLEGVELVNASTGGEFQDGTVEAYWGPLEEVSGAKVIQDAVDQAKLTASVEAGQPAFDIVIAGQTEIVQKCGNQYQPVNTDIVDMSNVVPEFITTECGVPQLLYGTVVAYNSEALGGKVPTSIADYFDTENFPGKRGVGMPPWIDNGVLEMGLLADGVSTSDLKPADIEHAFELFEGLGSDLVPWTSGAQATQQLESGEVAMSIVFNGRAYAAAQENSAVGVLWDGWVAQVDQLAVPVGVKDPDAAFAAINFTLGEQQQSDFVKHTLYSPVIQDPTLPELEVGQMDWILNEHLDTGENTNPEFWSEHWDELTTRWSEWVSGV